MSNIQQRKSVLPRWVLRLIGFSSLATVLVSLSLYLYKRSSTQRRINRSTHDSSDQDDEDTSLLNEENTLFGSLTGVRKNRKKMTISLQNTALSKESDPSFYENTAELLMHLSLIYDVYIIIHVDAEEDATPFQRLMMDEGLFSSDAGLDSRKILFCQTEEGKIHIIRHIEPFCHIEGGLENDDGEEIVDKLKPFVSKITWITQRDVTKPHVDVAKSLLNTSVAREVMRK